jgi:predicted O-methyltransferase YrrM
MIPVQLRARILEAVATHDSSHAPMPLDEVLALRRAVLEVDDRPDLLPRLMPRVHADASHLASHRLRELLRGRELGEFALSADSIDHLERVVREDRPACVLEFGSGASTLALRSLLDEHVGTDAKLVSVEQSAAYMEQTRVELEQAGLGRVRFHHAPVARRMINGVPLDCADLRGLPEAMQGARAELLLIDGPAGAPGSRVHVLPNVIRQTAPGCRVLLDDALRDGELWLARLWREIFNIKIEGVVMVGKGALTGRVIRPSLAPPAGEEVRAMWELWKPLFVAQ